MPARKTNKKTTAKKATKKVEELNQTHGKDEMAEKMAPSSLSQVWGDTGISKYKTLDEGEYTSYLKSLNKTDLHRHAAEMGIIPIENKENLYKRLIGEFTKHTASYRMPQVKPPVKTLSRKAKDILSEGR
jgi:hypothetical protein